jgi:hypothetical protein
MPDQGPRTIPSDAIDPDWLSMLDKIARQPWAWIEVKDLLRWSDRCPRDGAPEGVDWPGVPWVIHYEETVTAMLEAGWLEPWTPFGEPLVSLPVELAERMRIEVIEQGPNDQPRWGRTTNGDEWTGEAIILPSYADLPTADPRIICQKYDGELPLLREIVDPAPGPVAQAEEAEEREKVAMMREEVMTYDESKDEWTVDVVETPLVLFGQAEIKVERRIKGKR